jgi:hypothetical protein
MLPVLPNIYKIHAMAEGSRSSSGPYEKASTPLWFRWGMPSIADLIFVALLCALVFIPLSVKLLGDAGIGWHIRTGQQILATHSVPRVDSFSSTMQGKPWFAWEWLYDVTVGALDSAWGLNGPVWFTAVVVAAVFAWLFRLLIQRGADLIVALGFWLLAISASTIHLLARPHVLSWLFAVAWFWILDSTEQISFDSPVSPRRLWFLPLLMLLWVNVHGGFLLGFVLLGIFWIGASWSWWRARGSRLEELLQKLAAGARVRSLTLVSVATAVASLLNPYGWTLHEHIIRYLSNRFLMDHIEEFQSPNFHGLAPRCFLALLLLSTAVLMVRGRELRSSELLTALFVIYAGLYASRNIPVSSILLAIIAGPRCHGPKALEGFLARMERIQSELTGHLWPILSVVLTLAVVAHGGHLGPSQLIDAHFDPARMPVEAVSFLRTQPIKGPILSPDYWGGYLIYTLYPQAQVVLDDRHDLYGAEFLKSYLRMVHVEDGWDSMLHKTGPAYLLLPRGTALDNVMSKTAGWRSIYGDKFSVIFVRDTAKPQTSSVDESAATDAR